jgi:hypothetical protein
VREKLRNNGSSNVNLIRWNLGILERERERERERTSQHKDKFGWIHLRERGYGAI